MSMSEPFEPQIERHPADRDEELDLHDDAGDGPDILPGNGAADNEGTLQEHEPTKDIPFRRPTPGDHLTPEQLEAELDD
jgi:hypothetical protein